MRVNRKYKLIILIPAFWSCLFDTLITAINQPAEYWNGDLLVAIEGNPIACFFMLRNVSGIFVFTFLWLAIIWIISYFLPPKLLRIFSLFILVAHTFGAASWLSEIYDFWWAVVLAFFNAILFIILEDVYASKIKLDKKT